VGLCLPRTSIHFNSTHSLPAEAKAMRHNTVLAARDVVKELRSYKRDDFFYGREAFQKAYGF